MVENIIEAMVDALLVVDIDGKIVLANSAAAALTGLPRDQLKSVPVSTILVDDTSGLRTVVRQRIADGDVLRREESWLVHKDGSRIPVSVTGSPVVADNGDLQGIVIVARDVREVRTLLTEKEAEIGRRREAEDQLRAAKSTIEEQLDSARSQLVQAERRATLGTLAGGIGHELRNIGQVLVSVVDELDHTLDEPGDHAAEVRELMPDFKRVTEHITMHGQRLLQLARPGPDRVGSLDLNAVVRDVVAMLTGAGKLKRVSIALELASEPLVVTVNRTRIEQILVNLVVNAVDAIVATKARGTITLATRAIEGNQVSCEVRDDGSGIPPDHLEKIFQAFFTTKPEDQGTGLGLPVARSIVHSYGGEMTVASTVGVGTTFAFTLPR
nr:ATP-binding protein [Kofleriaceae bacterium]